jgi:hypothetical protein
MNPNKEKSKTAGKNKYTNNTPSRFIRLIGGNGTIIKPETIERQLKESQPCEPS